MAPQLNTFVEMRSPHVLFNIWQRGNVQNRAHVHKYNVCSSIQVWLVVDHDTVIDMRYSNIPLAVKVSMNNRG